MVDSKNGSENQYILGGKDENIAQNYYKNDEQITNTRQDPQAAGIQQEAGDDKYIKTNIAKSDGKKIGALKKHYADMAFIAPNAGVRFGERLLGLPANAASMKDIEALEHLVKAQAAVQALINKKDADAEQEAEMDGKQHHGLHNAEKKQKQSDLSSIRIAKYCSAINKQYEDQENLTELSGYSLLYCISLLLDGNCIYAAFFSGKYFMDPKKALSAKLDGMIPKTGEDIDSSQNGVSVYDDQRLWQPSVKDSATLVTIMIHEKLAQGLRGRDRGPEKSGHHDRVIERIYDRIQRDETAKAVGPSLPQLAVEESGAPGGTASSQETANPLDELDLQSNDTLPPGDGRQSLKLTLDFSGTDTLRDHLDGIHDLTTVKMAAHTTQKSESSERLPSDCQSDSDLATDSISNSSPEATLESEMGATSHDSSQTLQEDIAKGTHQNSSEITQTGECEASRQNLSETPHEGQAPAPNQNLPEVMQEEFSETSGESLPKVLQSKEFKTVDESVPTREQGSIAEASTNSVNEFIEAPLHEEDSTSPPQSVRVHSPVAVSSVGSSDSRYYDGSYFIHGSVSFSHSHEESSPLTGSLSHGFPCERPPVMVHPDDKETASVSSDNGLNGPSEPCTLHSSQGSRGVCGDDFSEQTSCTQSASEGDRHTYCQPQEPVVECGHTSTESQLVLSTQVQTKDSHSTTECSTPSTGSIRNEAHHHGDHSNPARIHLPPIIVHAASALPPWAAQTAGIDLSQAANRQFAALRRRRGTYDESWPNYCDIDPTNMSLAGFYCIGPGRRVRCFYCGLELEHLTTEHNIWDEHVRLRHTCAYLRGIMGEDLVELTLINLKKLDK